MLTPDLQRAIDRAREGVDAIEELGRARAEAERDYRVALRKAVLSNRSAVIKARITALLAQYAIGLPGIALKPLESAR